MVILPSEKNYRFWLKLTASYYHIPQKLIKGGRDMGGKNDKNINVWKAKQTFYHLLLKNSIDIYKVSKQLGKATPNIMNMIKRGSKKHRDREAEEYLFSLIQLINQENI